MAITTPPLRPIAEPPTPHHGAKFDTHEPYEPRRRSSRLRTLRTPSPSATPLSNSKLRSGGYNLSPPSSPLSPDSRPRKRTREGASSDMASKVKPNMLPTPVKTPRKNEAKVKPAARVLFPHRLDTVEDPTPKKRGKKIAFSLDSPGASPDGKIEIFEDSKDKIPEVDQRVDNPFYTRSKGKDKGKDSVHKKEIERVLERDEGMIYVFRGKKIYRKFDDGDYDNPPVDGAMSGLPAVEDTNTPRHFTRSSIKPRLLFPKQGKTGDTTDEEAVTDIEYPQGSKGAETPAKKRVYVTPPTTARTTRTKQLSLPSSPAEAEAKSPFSVKRAKKSAFDAWQRSKPGAASRTRKRDAESPVKDEGSKRQKSKT